MYKTRHAWLFLIPTGILLLTFSLIPAVWAFFLGFTNYNVFQPMEWVGLDNYMALVQDGEFWNALGNTFYFWILVTPALVTFPILIAVLVNQKLRGINIYRLIMYFPFLVSVVITALLWGWMFQSEGILNYFLSWFNIRSVDWLTDRLTALPSLGIITIWQGLGYYMLIYLAGLQAIPNNLYEAAEIDGAGFWRKQWYVTFPMLKPIIFFVAVISTIGAFKEFALMLVMTEGGPLGATTTVVYRVFEEAFQKLNMGYASAMSSVLFVIILLLTILNQRLFDRDT